MTSDVFTDLLTQLNRRYRKQNRKILLMLDNCSSHPKINLTNIELLFLPPNSTSRTQPLDAGIIRSFKQRYRNQSLEYIIQCLESEENCEKVIRRLNLLNAIHFMDSSLKSIPSSVFINCFKTCGIEFESEVVCENSDQLIVSTEHWNQMRQTLNLDFDSFELMVSFDDRLICRQELTDEEILESVRSPIPVDSDETDIETEEINNEIDMNQKIPNNIEALKNINNLRLYLGLLESVDHSYYDSLNELEKLVLNNKQNSKQTLITDFFQNNQ